MDINELMKKIKELAASEGLIIRGYPDCRFPNKGFRIFDANSNHPIIIGGINENHSRLYAEVCWCYLHPESYDLMLKHPKTSFMVITNEPKNDFIVIPFSYLEKYVLTRTNRDPTHTHSFKLWIDKNDYYLNRNNILKKNENSLELIRDAIRLYKESPK